MLSLAAMAHIQKYCEIRLDGAKIGVYLRAIDSVEFDVYEGSHRFHGGQFTVHRGILPYRLFDLFEIVAHQGGTYKSLRLGVTYKLIEHGIRLTLTDRDSHIYSIALDEVTTHEPPGITEKIANYLGSPGLSSRPADINNWHISQHI